MSDDRRTAAVELPGEPAAWPAAIRELLRHLRAETPSREATVEWLLAETDASDRAAAEEGLAFLEAVGLVDASGAGCTPGPYGIEYLETDDEDVLYAALTSAVGGFETLLESLAVRPLTDVEFMDLLEWEFDAEMASPEPIVPHRRWLEALGYLDHEDGVNELTREGRRLVRTTDELTPPNVGAARGRGQGRSSPASGGADAGSTPRGGAGPEASPAGSTPGSSVRSREADGAAEEGGAGTAPEAERPAGADDPAAGAADEGVGDLRRRYDDACAVCGDRRRRAPEEGFSRVYRPMPLEEPHGGPAVPENAVVVCPNHYADFEHGLLAVDPRTLEIEHAYESELSGRTLATAGEHEPGAQYLAYHNQVVADF